MVYKGHVRNGVIVLADGVRLPEGAEVLVTVVVAAEKDEPAPKSFAEHMREFSGCFDGPADLAENHDHYLYGTPKRKPGQ